MNDKITQRTNAVFKSTLAIFQEQLELGKQLKLGVRDPKDASLITYWQVGHAFDTVLDFFELNHAVAAEYADQLAETLLELYPILERKSASWYDDFGWWGIATLKASQQTQWFTTAQIEGFENIYKRCFGFMNHNSRIVWKRAQEEHQFQKYEPRVKGGCWNVGWVDATPLGDTATPAASDRNYSKDEPESLAGIQNTVTNGLFLVFSARLAKTFTNVSEFSDASSDIAGFFKQWLEVIDGDGENDKLALLNVDTDFGNKRACLVRERMTSYSKCNEDYYPIVSGYWYKYAWSGDQGLALAGALDRAMVADDKDEAAFFENIAVDLLRGVSHSIACKGGEMPIWMMDDNSNDPADYSTGIGVFMRYLLHAYRFSSQQEEIERLGYPEVIRSSTKKIMENDKSTLTLQATEALRGNTNDLAILLLAQVMPLTCP